MLRYSIFYQICTHQQSCFSCKRIVFFVAFILEKKTISNLINPLTVDDRYICHLIGCVCRCYSPFHRKNHKNLPVIFRKRTKFATEWYIKLYILLRFYTISIGCCVVLAKTTVQKGENQCK